MPVRKLTASVLCAGSMLTPIAAAQDGGAPANAGQAQPEQVQPGQVQPEEMITFPDFSAPVELRVLVDFAASQLGINMDIEGNLSGTVALNAPISFPKSQLLTIVNALLEQRGFAITYDELTTFYRVGPKGTVGASLGGGLATTRIIHTPNIKPSQIASTVSAIIGDAGVKATYLDDLSTIIITASPRLADTYESLIKRVIEELSNMKLMRIDVRFVDAPTAIKQIVELDSGQQQQSGPQIPGAQPVIGGGQGGTTPSGTHSNLSGRLIVSPQGNAIIFRGREDELVYVQNLLEVIDRPNSIEMKRYYTGTYTSNIAKYASASGLGEVTQFETTQQQAGLAPGFSFNPQTGQYEQQSSTIGGSRIVADPNTGYTVYYGTLEQQVAFGNIVDTFKPENDIPVVRAYRLRYAKAEQVAEILQAILSGQQQSGEIPLGAGGVGQFPGQQPAIAAPPGEGSEESFSGVNVFATADIDNNQIVVKAPIRQQEEMRKLIQEKLDIRRAQVFLKAQIIAVNASEDFQLAFETQLINANGRGGVFETNFGLSAARDDVLTPKTVLAGLQGATAALIKSQYVPIIVNALQRDVDGRVIATPSILANDNEPATVMSVETFPFLVQSQTTNSTLSSFEEAEAGTTFEVTPIIGDSGYVTLEYSIEQSRFSGSPPSEGAPPPQASNTITGNSSVPSGMTIVLGGISFKNLQDTVVKLPLIGEIPLLGLLFSDTQKIDQESIIYVFITPEVIRDEDYRDLALLTKGPQAEVALDPDLPPLKPVFMEMYDVSADPVNDDAGLVRAREDEGEQ